MALSWTENTNFLINRLRKMDFFLDRFDHIFTLTGDGTLIYREHTLVAASFLLMRYYNDLSVYSASDSDMSLNNEIYFFDALHRLVQQYSCCLVPVGTWLRPSAHNPAFSIQWKGFGILGKYKGSFALVLSSGAALRER